MPTTSYLPPPPTTQGSNLSPTDYQWMLILQGLAAMGTAKTVHPGVALAAGLGAGSQSYLDTQKSLASTQVEQEKAQSLDIANQLGKMKIQAAAGYLGKPAAPTVPGAPALP